MVETQCFLTVWQERGEHLQTNRSWVIYEVSSPVLLDLQQNEPKLKGEGGLFCFGIFLFFFTENVLVFVSRSTVGKSSKPLEVLMGKGIATEAAWQDPALFCWKGLHARARKFWGPDLAVNSCASLPCPPGPCHRTGKVCLYQFFRGILCRVSLLLSSSTGVVSWDKGSHGAAGHPRCRLYCEMGQG